MRLVGIVLFCSLLTSCDTVRPEDIEGQDNGASFPSLRATWEFSRDSTVTRTPGSAEPELGIEVDLGYGAGSADQMLGATEFVVLNGARLNGPGPVATDYDLLAGSVSLAASRRWLGDAGNLTGLAGLGFQRLNIDIASGPGTASDDILSGGFFLGGQVTVQPLDRLSLSARASATIGVDSGNTMLGAAELTAEWMPIDRVGVFSGWRWWTYRRGNSEDAGDDSNLDLGLSGPVAGLSLKF